MLDSPGFAARVTVVLAWVLAGCAPAGPPRIASGSACAHCGMPVEDRRFACERRDPGPRGHWHVYDSIECLAAGWDRRVTIRDAWIADYDQAALHRADSLWVVRGRFPSPMGGGLAAFLDRAAAGTVATQTHGEMLRFDRLLNAPGASP